MILIVTADSRELFEENIIPAINDFLKPRGLMLSPKKTKIVRIEEGVDFSGQNLRKYRNKLITKPSKENAQSFLSKIRDTIKRCHGWKTEDMIRKLNPIIRGWAHYHRYVQSAKTFSYANKIIFESLWRWIRRRHPEKSCRWIIKNYFNSPNHNWGFCCWVKDRSGKKKLLELIKPTYIKLVRYIKSRGGYQPFDPKYSEYFSKRAISSNYYPIA